MTPLLRAAHLSFSYSHEQPVLHDVGLTLNAGEVTALLGPNGSGKSTLIRCLLGQLKCQGDIEWSGRPIQQWPRRELAKQVAYLAQSPVFDADQSVADALRLGRYAYWRVLGLESDADLAIVAEIARRLGLDDLLNRPMDQLSGGQRQRVFLGRCLVQAPQSLLLDEPNTYLDLRHQVELCRLLRELAREKNMAVLMASHDLNLAAAYADKVMLLENGRVARFGSAAEVYDAKLLGRVYGLQLKVMNDGPSPVIVPT